MYSTVPLKTGHCSQKLNKHQLAKNIPTRPPSLGIKSLPPQENYYCKTSGRRGRARIYHCQLPFLLKVNPGKQDGGVCWLT